MANKFVKTLVKSAVKLMLVSAMAISLGACGRRGALQPPPTAQNIDQLQFDFVLTAKAPQYHILSNKLI